MILTLLLVAQTATATSAAASTPPAPRVEVIIEDVEERGGELVVALYQTKATWLKVDQAARVQTVPARRGRAQVAFDALPAGEYAVSVIHDVNKNRKLDMKWFPIPRPAEGAAVSNDANASFGPPKYDDARIAVKEPKKIVRVHMRY